jgi:hypothetical protein
LSRLGRGANPAGASAHPTRNPSMMRKLPVVLGAVSVIVATVTLSVRDARA